jgi:hypothetical protein
MIKIIDKKSNINKLQHRKLAQGDWQKLSIAEQMANIGSEVVRASKWKEKGRDKLFKPALSRMLELIDLTASCHKNNLPRLTELLRTRECLLDFLVGENAYGSTISGWQKYFYAFNLLVRKPK